MKLSQAKDYLPLVQAATEGKTIEVSVDGGENWKSVMELYGDVHIFDESDEASGRIFRIKPEPKLRPWKPEEVPVGALIRAKGEKCWIIVGRDTRKVAVSNDGCARDFDYCLEVWEHSTDGGKTWKPCGVYE